jgi:hypothetical protein
VAITNVPVGPVGAVVVGAVVVGAVVVGAVVVGAVVVGAVVVGVVVVGGAVVVSSGSPQLPSTIVNASIRIIGISTNFFMIATS